VIRNRFLASSTGAQLAASGPLGTGVFSWLHFTVAGGEVELELSGDPAKHWRLNALVIV